ncbi:MAG TPA: CbiX/SirB N-terminal domain-containing protein [Patescibacteria group bacterium]|nr:CbiX/SirB N-terminal domain-containing protein [Patescibacteria group bacterium]
MTEWNKAALLLVGHGSSRVTTSRDATSRLAETMRAQNLFAEVRECFWKEAPFLSLDLVAAPLVYVVPNFAGEGVFTRKLIPDRLGLNGRLTALSGRRVVYTDPVGSHPGMPALLQRRAESLCAANAIAPEDTALVVIGHGSSRPGGSSGTPEAVAATLRADSRFAEVVTAFIEQEPRVADWPALVRSRHVIAAPLLISEGMHASEDLPPLFGLATPQGGPVETAGRQVWLMGGIGRDPEVVDIILDQIRAAEAEIEQESRLRA